MARIRGAAEHHHGAAGSAHIGDRFRRRVVAHDHDIGIVGEVRRRAQPGELAWIELHLVIVAHEAEQPHLDDAESRICASEILRKGVEPAGEGCNTPRIGECGPVCCNQGRGRIEVAARDRVLNRLVDIARRSKPFAGSPVELGLPVRVLPP